MQYEEKYIRGERRCKDQNNVFGKFVGRTCEKKTTSKLRLVQFKRCLHSSGCSCKAVLGRQRGEFQESPPPLSPALEHIHTLAAVTVRKGGESRT